MRKRPPVFIVLVVFFCYFVDCLIISEPNGFKVNWSSEIKWSFNKQ
jgi:hypothetical protein